MPVASVLTDAAVWVYPSIVTELPRPGSGEPGVIVQTPDPLQPVPVTLNAIVSVPEPAAHSPAAAPEAASFLAALIASRNVH